MPAHDPHLRSLASLAGVAVRRGRPDADDRRRELAAERLRLYITKVVDEAPPLTPEQRARLAELLIVRNAA